MKYLLSGILLSLFTIATFVTLASWETGTINTSAFPELDYNSKLAACMKVSHVNKSEILHSFGNAFKVEHVAHNSKQCINPDWPSLRLTAKQGTNAWLAIIVDFDSPIEQYREKAKHYYALKAGQSHFPFVENSQSLTMSPISSGTLLYKRVVKLTTHLYAVKFDKTSKAFHIVGGFEVEQRARRLSFVNTITINRALNKHDWEADYKSIANKLGPYHISKHAIRG